MNARTIRKTAETLAVGDRIVTSTSAVYFDRIRTVEHMGDGRTRVQCEGYNGWTYYLAGEQVRVLPAEQSA